MREKGEEEVVVGSDDDDDDDDAYDGVGPDLGPGPGLVGAGGAQDGLVVVVEDDAAVLLGQRVHGFDEGRFVEAAGDVDAVALEVRVSIFASAYRGHGTQKCWKANLVTRKTKKAHPGPAGEDEELQSSGEFVDGADDTLEHASVDAGLDAPVIFLLVCCGPESKEDV